MFNYIPEFFKGETADNDEEAERWYAGQEEQPAHARPAAPRRGGARHQLRGQGGPRHRRTAACSSTSARGGRPTTSASGCRRCTTSSRSWRTSTSPRSRWRSGPTCHYIMGGVRVERRLHAGAPCPASSRPARWRAACTAPTASAATRSPTCSCSAGAPGCTPRSTPRTSAASSRSTPGQVESIVRETLEPFERGRRREPVRDPGRPAGDDAGPGRHHPHRGRAEGSAQEDRGAQGARAARCGSRAAGRTTPAGTWRST